MLEEFLMHIGLSDKEAKVYMSLLKVDDANAAAISKSSNINRTTVYPILESSKHKGLVEEIEKNGKSTFRSNSPEKIETYIEEQKIKLDEQSKLVRDMIPKFKAVARGLGERPIVEYYTGKEEVLRSAKNMFTSGEEGVLYVIYPRDEIEKSFSPKELDSLKQKRIEKNIKIVSIYSYSQGEYNSDITLDRKRVDPEKYPIKAEIGIYGESTRIHIFGKHAGTVFIKSVDVAETLRSLFRLAFDGSNK